MVCGKDRRGAKLLMHKGKKKCGGRPSCALQAVRQEPNIFLYVLERFRRFKQGQDRPCLR